MESGALAIAGLVCQICARDWFQGQREVWSYRLNFAVRFLMIGTCFFAAVIYYAQNPASQLQVYWAAAVA